MARAPEQLRAPPHELLPAAAAPRLLPDALRREPGAGSLAASPPLQGRLGRLTPPAAWSPWRAPAREVSVSATPGAPGLCFPQQSRSPWSWAHAATGAEKTICCSGSRLREAGGTSRELPTPGGGRTDRVPAPLSAPGSGVSRASGWVAQSFILNPSRPIRGSGVQGMGRTGAGGGGLGGRGVGGDAALLAARLLCSPQQWLRGTRAGWGRGQTEVGSRRCPACGGWGG